VKASTILLLCAAAIGAIAFHPSAASADIDFNIGSQGTSVCLGSCNPAPDYQAPVVIEQRPVIVEEHTPEWRQREEWRRREEIRLGEERRYREEARLREERRLADGRYRDQRFDSHQSDRHVYNPNERQNYSSSNSRNYDRRDR
jgi:hypothetical protein